MPLLSGKANIGRNIKELMATGRSQKQAIAIAERVAGNARPKKRRTLLSRKG